MGGIRRRTGSFAPAGPAAVRGLARHCGVALLGLLGTICLLGATGCGDENEPQGLGPVSVSAFADGEGPFATADLIANAWANHPVGTPAPTFSYSWTCNGACPGATGPYTTSTVPATDTTKSDVWEVTATATFDSTILGPASDSVAIINSVPEVVLDRITDRFPDCPNDSISVVSTPSDADGDPVTLTYEWTVNNIVEPAATTDSIDCQYFAVGDRLRVSVRPFDGEALGRIQRSNLVTVGPPPSPAQAAIASPTEASTTTEATGALAHSLDLLAVHSLSSRTGALDVTQANACHIGPDGTIACTGEETHGLTEPPEGYFSQLAVELDYACALRAEDASIVCWGDPVEDSGQTNPPRGAFAQVDVGATAACAVGVDGTIACWGEDANGLTSPPAGVFVELGVAGSSGCAIDGSALVACWGQSE